VIRLFVLIVARPGEVKGLVAALRSIMVQALGEPGCLECHLTTDLTNPSALHYAEHWTSEAQFRQQVSSARFRRLAWIIEAAAHPPRLEVQLVSQTRGLDYVQSALRGEAL